MKSINVYRMHLHNDIPLPYDKKDGGFSFPVAAGFVVLHFIWFDVFESWIKKRSPVFH